MSKKLVAVAISGGVDSSVAALLLKKQGYEVIGLHMHLLSDTGPYGVGNKIKADRLRHGVEEVCRGLAISLHIVELQEEFKKYVIDYFCQRYAQGYTPNPCIMCNRYLKFGRLIDKAFSLGAEAIATGHYARIKCFNNTYHLLKGKDLSKDQSYVLYNLKQDTLKHVIFPLGDYCKTDIRKIARENNLPVSDEASSQDICFIDGKYGDFLHCCIERSLPGDIITRKGEKLGTHRGIMYYTIGQRQGLGISANSRLFVVAMDSVKNRLIVGTEQELYSNELIAGNVNWLQEKPYCESIDVDVKIRYRSLEVAAKLYLEDDNVRIQFLQSQRAVAPGQSVVFYKDDEVIGGGIIEKGQ
jgi:tRNA-uridine 2-sulfurtransferase